jgi:phosphatidylglycerophosphate synthase
MSVLILCILLRIGAVGAFLVFAKERHRELQLSRRQTATVFLVLMATLLPLPFSLVGLLAVLYLSSSRFFVPEATSFATIYKKHEESSIVRRHGFEVTIDPPEAS